MKIVENSFHPMPMDSTHKNILVLLVKINLMSLRSGTSMYKTWITRLDSSVHFRDNFRSLPNQSRTSSKDYDGRHDPS